VTKWRQSFLLADPDVEASLQDAVSTDLDRTFPDNVYFMNGRQEDQKTSLRNVLVAYGRYNQDVAYCQVGAVLDFIYI